MATVQKKLIITKETFCLPDAGVQGQYQVCALYEGGRMAEAAVQPSDAESILNNMYVARVQNIAAGLDAAFVEIGPGRLCFLPMENVKNPLFTKKISQKPLAAGDELVVQVVKEAMKSKEAVVTTNLGFAGEYLVLTSANHKTGLSSKLPAGEKQRLAGIAQSLCLEGSGFGLIMRTNAAGTSEAAIRAEFLQLKAEYETVKAHASTRTVFSCLRRERPFYLKMLEDTDKTDLEEVVTDDEDIFSQLNGCQMPASLQKPGYAIRLYEDPLLPLGALYSIKTQLEAARKPRVWLKSGANIVIQPTEALTVIDVNSGKNILKKQKQQYHYQINLEAAKEIAVQLRLRNISGIVIIDFIDLYDESLNTALLSEFRAILKRDPVPVRLAGMTKLGLVELTRKKVKKPLAEQFTRTDTNNCQ